MEEFEEEETAGPNEPVVIATKPTASPSTPTKKSKNKKKKRKPLKEDTATSSTPTEGISTPTPKSQLDDIDLAIQEISKKYGDAPSPSSRTIIAQSTIQKYSLLSVSPKHLDADLELRKLFGKIVDIEARESRRQSIHGIPPRVINRIKASQAHGKKHVLMKPKDEWQLFAAYNKRMLSMDILPKSEGGGGGVTKFKFVHSRKYQEIQMHFFIIALGGDGNILIDLLRQYPFHVDTWYATSCRDIWD